MSKQWRRRIIIGAIFLNFNLNVFVEFSLLVTYNVLELCLVRFETFSYRNITDKDTMFVAICKAKIIVFRGATAFANALLSARIRQRCCYNSLPPLSKTFECLHTLLKVFLRNWDKVEAVLIFQW